MGIFILIIFIVLISFVIYEVKYIQKWQGTWRYVMTVPLLVLGGAFLDILIGTSINSSSHNLFPFELLIWLFVALLVKFVLVIMRKIIRKEKI